MSMLFVDEGRRERDSVRELASCLTLSSIRHGINDLDKVNGRVFGLCNNKPIMCFDEYILLRS